MIEKWTQWVDHDGSGCPVSPDTIVAVLFREPPPFPECSRGNPDFDMAGIWVWGHDGDGDDIIRYRIRKPRGLAMLEKIAQDVKMTVDTHANQCDT